MIRMNTDLNSMIINALPDFFLRTKASNHTTSIAEMQVIAVYHSSPVLIDSVATDGGVYRISVESICFSAEGRCVIQVKCTNYINRIARSMVLVNDPEQARFLYERYCDSLGEFSPDRQFIKFTHLAPDGIGESDSELITPDETQFLSVLTAF